MCLANLINEERLAEIYGNNPQIISYQKERYENVMQNYANKFVYGSDLHIFSASGRTEIGGNHTDHQMGQVLAASLNIDSLAVASKNDSMVINLYSEGYKMFTVDLTSLEVIDKEIGTTTGLIRGVAAGFAKKGFQIGGFNAYVVSDVLSGSGLSSSASFESLVGVILSGLFNEGKVSTVDIAKIGQFAENVYMGKPCGLMDQMACAVGGFVHIDFKKESDTDCFMDNSYPSYEKIEFNPADYGYTLCITDTNGSHAGLTDEYAAIPAEMKAVAACFGKEVLSQVSEEEFIKNIANVKTKVGDRSVLRAIHYFEENKRVIKEAKALEENNFDAFLKQFLASGNSSYKYLQNIYSSKDVTTQPISTALAVSDIILDTPDKGIARVHGGGFAGTIQAFVKNEYADEYIKVMNSMFGEGASTKQYIRKYGCVQVV